MIFSATPSLFMYALNGARASPYPFKLLCLGCSRKCSASMSIGAGYGFHIQESMDLLRPGW